MELVIAAEDPSGAEIRRLLATHLAFAREVTPAGHVHAIDVERPIDAPITFFAARHDGWLLGIGALRELDPAHGELKSMHTVAAARGHGVGRAIVDHIVRTARARGYERLSLETGTYDAFAPARALYASVGFTVCAPFGDYAENAHSTCMTLRLDRGE